MAQVGTGLSGVPSAGANLIAAGISGGSNIITGVINSALQAGSSHQNRVLARWQTNQQLEENQRSRDWSSFEAQKARDYDWNLWQDQKDFDREMFEKTLPENQVLNLLKAGINPAAYFNQSGASATPAVANGSPAGSPMPSASTAGVQSSNPGITTAPVIDSIFGGFADFIKKLAEAKKLGVETEGLEKMIPEQLKNWLLQNKNLEVSNEIQQFNANILPKIKNQELKNLAAEWEKKMSEVALNQSESDLNEWKSMTEQFQQKLLDEKSGLTKYERMIAAQQLPYISRQMESSIEANRASAEKSRAEAAESGERTKAQKLLNNISEATNLYDIDNAIYNADTLELMKQSSNKEDLYQQLERQLKVSRLYQDSNTKKKIDATLENVRKILGLGIFAHAHN